MYTKKIIGSLILGCAVMTTSAYAGGSVQHSGQAVKHSAQATTHAVVGGVKLTMGLVAIPLGVAGSVGHASGQVGQQLWEEANAPIGEPLPIADESVIAGPSPEEIMKVKGEQI